MKVVLCWVFLGSLFAIISLLHSWHFVDMNPRSSEKLLFSEKILKPGKKGIVHLLKADCGCSNIVAKKLSQRKSHSMIKETVIFIGPMEDFEAKFLQQGFDVQVWNESDFLKQNSVDGAPMLLVYNEKKQIQYFGGYTSGMVTPDKEIKDQKIIKQTLAGNFIKPLPTIGCAVSNKMKNRLDPLGIKYTKLIE